MKTTQHIRRHHRGPELLADERRWKASRVIRRVLPHQSPSLTVKRQGNKTKNVTPSKFNWGDVDFFLRNSEPLTVNSSDFALFHRDTFQRTDTERAASDAVAKSLEEKTDRLVETLSANTYAEVSNIGEPCDCNTSKQHQER